MKFILQFQIDREEKENLYRRLLNTGLTTSGVQVKGTWVAVKTGLSYALVESDSASELWKLCSEVADFGQLTVEPVVEMKEIVDLL